MADQNITELPLKTSSGITASDYLLGIDSAEGYQMLIRDLGDYIIRNVAVNPLGGANQTLKAAIDSLNSNLQTVLNSQTTERGKSFAEHLQLQLDANKLPIGRPFLYAIDFYEKGTKPTIGYLYLSNSKVYGNVLVSYDNSITVVSFIAGIASQKTITLS